ncbi:MAG: tryptophan--tRNA ligase [Planctomycetes bacterium]|nr:tryptophan--tRNA ligase [Planctomycetota bacterium]NOG55146.1 tryptophan--tRNA ligase [Planctomycetota bacterium]
MNTTPGSPVASDRPRILTGDTPTGRLHLGHYVGSLERRLALQETHDCFFIIANVHAFTTRATQFDEIRSDVLEIVRDYLAVGIDPQRSTIFLQSEVPAIAELTFFFSMLLGYGRVMKNPTIKDEIRIKNLGDTYPFGFLLYAVGQTADILTFRPEAVPVGEDQVPHIEMTREVARRFNQVFCGVSDQVADEDHLDKGGLFPVPRADVGRVARLVGTDGTNKMSKSLNNAIFLSDTAKQVQKKVNKLYTGRQSPTDPGDPNNVLFQYHDAFNPDTARVAEMRELYAAGGIGDGDVKKELGAAINTLLEPMRQRRAEYEGQDDRVLDILRDGTARANAVAEETLHRAKQAMKVDLGPRSLKFQ